MRVRSRTFLWLVAAVALTTALPMVNASGATKPNLSIAKVGPKDGGGEPSIATGPSGRLFASYPASSGPTFFRSTSTGTKWTQGAYADTQSGDTSVNVDASGAIYQGNLNGVTGDPNMLQTDVYKSTDLGGHWTLAAGPISQGNSTNQPLFVDRPWTDAYIPPGGTTNTARVYLQYHDFGPSQIWVSTSTDGGAHFGLPVDVITSPVAQADTVCNSIPGGVKVVQSGPHAGRVYAAWLAADPATNLGEGCNITMLQTFHTVWIAWSDDGGTTWTDQLVFDGGIGHDASALFADLTLDNQGNPYVAFGDDLTHQVGQTTGNWNMSVMGSQPDPTGNPTWSGPFQANTPATQTNLFPAIAAGSPGQVDVGFIGSASQTPTLPYGKPQPGGDPSALWNVYMAQTLNLFASPAPAWAVVQVTPSPMHQGDVCTLGIFCVDPNSNRDLLDFIDLSIGTDGRAHEVYTNDITDAAAGIYAANQTGGPVVGAPVFG
jgi:hypothetical protein